MAKTPNGERRNAGDRNIGSGDLAAKIAMFIIFEFVYYEQKKGAR